jgi:uncharacterized membrane protein YdbT with pleckstrin-like domain
MKFIKDFTSVYLILFRALTPIVIAMSPVIPYLITNDATWLVTLFISIPLAVTFALKCWEFSGVTEPETNEQPRENINIEL